MHRRVVAAALAVIGLCAAGAAGASAAPVALGGTPDERLRRRARAAAGVPRRQSRTGSTTGRRAPPAMQGSSWPCRDARPRCTGSTATPARTARPTTRSAAQGAVTGSGTAADPLKQVTIYRTAASNGLEVTQTTTLRQRQPVLHHRLGGARTPTTTAAHFKAFAAADFFFDGSDRGTGHLHPGPAAVHRRHQRRHRQLGRLRRGPGHHGVVALPGARVRQRRQRGVGQDRRRRGRPARRPSTTRVVGEQVDNAGGVEWDQYATGAGLADERDRELLARRAQRASRRRCRSTRPTPARPRACRSTSPSAPSTPTGTPYAGKTIRYAITGANATPAPLTATVGPDGNAVITDPGTNAGPDTDGRLPGLQQQRDARGRRAAGLGAGDLRRQRPADVQGQGQRRPARRQRRRGQAADHHGQLQRAVDRHRPDDADAARQHARARRRRSTRRRSPRRR